MSWRQLFGDNRIILPYSEHSKSNFEPYEIGTGSSRLLKLIEEGHESVNMPEHQQKIIRHWLDAGANHAGTYAVNSHGTIGYYLHSVNVRNDKDWPERNGGQLLTLDTSGRVCQESRVDPVSENSCNK